MSVYNHSLPVKILFLHQKQNFPATEEVLCTKDIFYQRIFKERDLGLRGAEQWG